jgi:hypothetical protein
MGEEEATFGPFCFSNIKGYVVVSTEKTEEPDAAALGSRYATGIRSLKKVQSMIFLRNAGFSGLALSIFWRSGSSSAR